MPNSILLTLRENDIESETEVAIDSEEEEYFLIREEKRKQFSEKFETLTKTMEVDFNNLKNIGKIKNKFTEMILVAKENNYEMGEEEIQFLVFRKGLSEPVGILTEVIGNYEYPFFVCWIKRKSIMADLKVGEEILAL